MCSPAVLPPRWRELQAEAAAEGGWEVGGSGPCSSSEAGEDGRAAEEAAVGGTAAGSEAASSEQPEWADEAEAGTQLQGEGEEHKTICGCGLNGAG